MGVMGVVVSWFGLPLAITISMMVIAWLSIGLPLAIAISMMVISWLSISNGQGYCCGVSSGFSFSFSLAISMMVISRISNSQSQESKTCSNLNIMDYL
jgi:hypothetical protein